MTTYRQKKCKRQHDFCQGDPPDFYALLLAARLIQGLGASCGSVLTQAMVREALNEHKRNHFFSMVGFVLAFAISLGPFLGGYLTQWFDWRANFSLLVLRLTLNGVKTHLLSRNNCVLYP